MTLTLEERASLDAEGGRGDAPLRAAPAPGLRHRPDIDGLRAIAILLVVAYHAKVPGFSAGFIGVDVFFVLSGFLITRLILDEVDRTGSLHLGRFWLRRGRRLLPASALVVTATLAVSQWLDSPVRWKEGITEALAALTYWSNHLFAGRSTDYFGEAIDASPLLHTWSLAVEEQFYLLWPLVFFVTARFVAAGSRRAGVARFGVVAGLSLLSYALCWQLTRQESPAAFFAALSRAWEFGAGAMLAIAAASLASLQLPARRALAATGALLLGLALTLIGETTPFPGTAAVLPVAGTALLIAAAPSPERGLGRLLARRPLQVIGGLSYSWYLWHWPFVILGTDMLNHDGVATRVALSVLALLPAEWTRRFVENPVRRSPVLAGSNRLSLAVLAALMLSGASVAGTLWWRADRTLQDPLLATLVEARSDHGEVYGPCASTDPQTMIAACVGGNQAGPERVLVIGDSHASHWIPAVDLAAQELALAMTASVLGNCPSIDIQRAVESLACAERQAELPAAIDAVDPDIVVIGHSVGYLGKIRRSVGRSATPTDQLAAWEAALTQLARDLRDRGIGLVVILDTPRFDEAPIDCLARTRDPAACEGSAEKMRIPLAPFHAAERAALVRAGHGVVYDPLPHLCGQRCAVIVDGMVVYHDTDHLTRRFSRSFSADLAVALRAARPAPDARN